MMGAGTIFFAYIGFDAVSTAAQEAKNPQKDMPIGIIGSLVICTVLYVVFALVLTGMVPYYNSAMSAPVAAAIDKPCPVRVDEQPGEVRHHLRLHFRDPGDAAGTIPRVLLHVARRPGAQASFPISTRNSRRPGDPTCCSSSSSRPSPRFLPLSIVGHMTSIGTLFAFVIVCAGVWVMRVKNPDAPRPFKTPLVPLVPILGIVWNFAMMYSLGWSNWAAADRLAGHRPGDLLHLQPPPQPLAEGGPHDQPLKWGTMRLQ